MANPNVVPIPESIEYSEVLGSPKEAYDADHKFSATRVLRCAWRDRLALADDMLGGYEVQAGELSLVYPRVYPHRSGCYAKSVTIENWQGNGDENGLGLNEKTTSYEWAHLTVRYEPGNFNPTAANGGNIVQIAEESVVGAGQFLSPDGLHLWLYGSKKIDELPSGQFPGVYVPTATWTYSLASVRTIPTGWFTYPGYVNSAAVTSNSLNYTFAAETLLFEAPEISRTITQLGRQAWKATLKFSFRPSGWNKFPKLSTTGATFVNLYSVPATATGPNLAQDASTIRKPIPSTNFVTNLNLVL